MDIKIKVNSNAEPNAKEEFSSYDKHLLNMIAPIKEYLETNIPKNKTQERLLDIIRELINEATSQQ